MYGPMDLVDLTNPVKIQSIVLEELEARLGYDNGVIADPNNGFITLLEMSSHIAAEFARATDRQFEALYPKRATVIDDLYRHMSDFDYTHITSSPASTHIQLIFDRDTIIARSVPVNDTYRKLVIPRTTLFSIGSRSFGMYYPIEIRVNAITNSILVTYDTTIDNPLHPLRTNLVEFQQYKRDGLNLLSLKIPVDQFSRQDYVEPITYAQGFKRQYQYTHRFYACRVFTELHNVWQELDYTLSDDVYDRHSATAKLSVDTDHQSLTVQIPQVYFTKGLIGERVKVVIYTTEGAMDQTITVEDAKTCRVSFTTDPMDVTAYTTPLVGLSTLLVIPAEKRIVGGSNGISTTELKDRIIYGALYDPIPVTPLALQKYIEDAGFTPTQYLDNVTNRIYYAHKKFTSTLHGTIPTTIADIQIDLSQIMDVPTIRQFPNIITILPTTTYNYLDENRICVPHTSADILRIDNLPKEYLVTELNTTLQTRTPFHVVIYTDAKYPHAKTFNLLTPKITDIRFIRENAMAIPQMTTLTGRVLHLNQGTGGYVIQLAVSKSADLKSLDESNIKILLMTQDRADNPIHFTATYVSSLETYDLYQIQIPTSYKILSDRYFSVTSTSDTLTPLESDIGLTTEFDVRFLVTRTTLPSTTVDAALQSGLPEMYDRGYIALTQQMITVSFGEDLSPAIYNITDAVWTQEDYVTYPETVYHTYDHDVYETDASGALSYIIVDGAVQLNKLHSKGDVVKDSQGHPVIKHKQGDYVRDTEGRPITDGYVSLLFFVKSMMFDRRLYMSQNPQDIEYLSTLPAEISGYTTTIRDLQKNMIEQTKLYFHPVRTIGSSSFGIGNNQSVRLDLGLAFTVRYYVPRSVLSDRSRLSYIRTTTKTVIEDHVHTNTVISMTEIAKTLREVFASDITSIDALGINGAPERQTLISQDPGASPAVRLKLSIGDDGRLFLEKDITITFVSDV